MIQKHQKKLILNKKLIFFKINFKNKKLLLFRLLHSIVNGAFNYQTSWPVSSMDKKYCWTNKATFYLFLCKPPPKEDLT